MTFIPTPHTVVTEGIPPRARDLARNLEQAIQEYRTRNPGLTDAEIRQALALMGRSRAAGGPAVLMGLLLAGLAVMGLVVFKATTAGSGDRESVRWISLVVGALVVALGLMLAIRKRGGGAP